MKRKNNLSRSILFSLVIILSTFCLFGCGSSEEENALEDMALLDIIDEIYEAAPVELSIYSDSIDVTDPDAMSYNTGLTNLGNVREAALSETLISTQAYSMVLVRTSDESTVADTANEMKAGIDPSKWISVTADDLQIVSYRNVILLFMVTSELSGTITSQEIVDTFQEICGGAELVSY